MTNTRTLPTDKYGRVYYGPRTLAEAVKRIDEMRDTYVSATPAADVAECLHNAGFTGVAARVRKAYGVQS